MPLLTTRFPNPVASRSLFKYGLTAMHARTYAVYWVSGTGAGPT